MKESNNTHKSQFITPGFFFALFLIVCLFFLWAWPNILNDFLIRQFKKSLELSNTQAGFLPFALKTGFFCLAIPAGLYMERRGYKSGILVGLCLFATGCLLFYPAALSQQYLLFLGGIFVMAGGCAFIEIGSSSTLMYLGDKEGAERRLTLAASFNAIGSIIASTTGTYFIFSGIEPDEAQIAVMKATGTYAEFLRTENARVYPVYIALTIMILVVAVLIKRTKFPAAAAPPDPAQIKKHTEEKGSFKALLHYPHWWGGIISQFFYLAAQLGTWSWVIIYVKQNAEVGEKIAGAFLTANMVIFCLGRFFSTWIMKFFRPTKLMGIYAIINFCLITFSILGSKWGEARFGFGLNHLTAGVPFTDLTVPVSIYTLIFTAFFMSLMYPTNFGSGMKGLGPHSKKGASTLVMSQIGGAISALMIGRLADTSWGQVAGLAEPQIAVGLCIVMVAYLVITWYSFWGSKPRGPLYD
ncbi:MAG: sugar MFS transporter [Tannerella sp.]|jgi:FHS family L-fucose permease-like MFS transporter|nr:sugar MFS transporter [Tannerella sp.]